MKFGIERIRLLVSENIKYEIESFDKCIELIKQDIQNLDYKQYIESVTQTPFGIRVIIKIPNSLYSANEYRIVYEYKIIVYGDELKKVLL